MSGMFGNFSSVGVLPNSGVGALYDWCKQPGSEPAPELLSSGAAEAFEMAGVVDEGECE